MNKSADAPDWQKAKALLRAKFNKEQMGAPVDDYTLAWALGAALEDDVGVTDGPTTVSPAPGRPLSHGAVRQ